jgi:hypothetical protein
VAAHVVRRDYSLERISDSIRTVFDNVLREPMTTAAQSANHRDSLPNSQ